MVDCSLKKNKFNPICKKKNSCDIGESRFSVVLPKRDNSKRPINPKNIQKYIKKMNDVFGGTSTVPRLEGCVYDEGKFQCEQNIEIVGIRDFENPYDKLYGEDLSGLSCNKKKQKLKEDWNKVKEIGKEAMKEFGQESILVINDKINDAHFSFDKKPKKAPDNVINTYDKVIFPD